MSSEMENPDGSLDHGWGLSMPGLGKEHPPVSCGTRTQGQRSRDVDKPEAGIWKISGSCSPSYKTRDSAYC